MKKGSFSLTLREFEVSDYERLVEISNANYPDHTTSLNELRYADESRDRSKLHFKRYVGVDRGSGTIIGFGSIMNSAWTFHPQKYWIQVQVDPKYQGKGVGSQINSKLMQDLEKLHAMTAWAMLRDDMPKNLAFAMKRGFAEKNRAWESRLDLQKVDVARFQRYADKILELGIKITNLSEEMARTPGAPRKLYALAQELNADVPAPAQYTPTPFEQWETADLRNPNLIPNCYFIASDGPRYVGLSAAWRSDSEPRILNQVMTGVRREYRGQGIAMALKLRVIDFAIRNKYDKIKTSNDSDNAPMLAVNTKLGFKREVGWITMEKNLG